MLSDNPQKISGLAGVTLGVLVSSHLHDIISTDPFRSIVQSIATLITGSVLGLVFIWKVALVGIGEC